MSHPPDRSEGKTGRYWRCHRKNEEAKAAKVPDQDVSASDGHDDSPVQQVASEDRGSEEGEPEEAGAVGGELWTAVCYRGVPFSELGAREAASEGSRGWLCRIYAMASSRVGEGSVLQEPPLVVTGWVRSGGDSGSNGSN